MPKVEKQSPKGKSKTGSVVSRIGDMDLDDKVRILIYGRGGTGKTELWGTFPGKTLALICSGGKKAGELRTLNTPANRKRIKTVNLQSESELTDIVEEFEAGNLEFDNFVLDHASGYQGIILAGILGIDKLPEQLAWGTAKQQEWGDCNLRFKERMARFINIEANVIIVAHERSFDPGEGDNELNIITTVGAALTPGSCSWLNGACDYVVETFLRPKMITKTKTFMVGKKEKTKTIRTPVKGPDGNIEAEFCLRTAPDSTFMTKFRVPKHYPKPGVIVNPTYESIMKVINGEE
jgi:hypothetical protein